MHSPTLLGHRGRDVPGMMIQMGAVGDKGSVGNPGRGALGLTWGLCGAGLQVTGLFAHGFHQRVTAPHDVLALVALHIPHPHADPAGFCALGDRGRGEARPCHPRGLC